MGEGKMKNCLHRHLSNFVNLGKTVKAVKAKNTTL